MWEPRVDEALGEVRLGVGVREYSLHTPRHPGRLPQGHSLAGTEATVGRLGQWGRQVCLSLRSSAESRCQAHGPFAETHPASLDHEPIVCWPWGVGGGGHHRKADEGLGAWLPAPALFTAE